MKLYDISIQINNKTIVYRNNPKPKINNYSKTPKNKTNESLICIGSHTGTHFDSQLHIKQNGWSSASINLNSFYGKAIVIDLINCKNEINEEDLKKYKIYKNQIILLKTKNSNLENHKFITDYVHLSISGAKYLAKLKVKAVGIDYLSIEKFNSNLLVHKELLNKKILIFEGLKLNKIHEGNYTFIGFPLSLDIDAAPLRAVLMK